MPRHPHPSRAVAARDWVWRDFQWVSLVGPVTATEPASYRAALAALMAADPDHPLVCRLDRDRGRWVPVPPARRSAHLAAMVVRLDTASPAGAAEDLMRAPLDDVPFRIALADGILGFRIAHSLGDVRAAYDIFGAILDATATDGTPSALLEPSEPQPMRTALTRTFGRDLRRIQAVRATRNRPAAPRRPSQPWQPSYAVETVSGQAPALRAMKAWRRDHASGVSITSLLYVAVCQALVEVGLAPAWDRAGSLFDLRRYVGQRVRVDGNMVSASGRRFTDLTDPAAVQQDLQAEGESGLPLLAAAEWIAIDAVKWRLRPIVSRLRPQAGIVDRVPVPAAPELSLNSMGRVRAWPAVPWSAPESDRWWLVAGEAPAPEAMMVAVHEDGANFHVTMSFHESTFQRSLVAQALSRVVQQPAELLEAAAVRRTA
ncbi:MAG: hypothetical protein EPO13_02220 [Actinomycetota bacterium]|nr:MAG: hypothetical protein EPO13_02220 [Actinomycetota bacterium]